jgi:hypothetical protein
MEKYVFGLLFLVFYSVNSYPQDNEVTINEYWALSPTSTDMTYSHYSFRFNKDGTFVNEYAQNGQQKMIQYGHYFFENNKIFLTVERREPIKAETIDTYILNIIEINKTKIKLRYLLNDYITIEMERNIFE